MLVQMQSNLPASSSSLLDSSQSSKLPHSPNTSLQCVRKRTTLYCLQRWEKGVWGLVHLESLCIYYYLHIWTYEFKYLVLRCSFVFGRSGIAPCEVLPPCEMMSSVGENYRNCKWDEVVTSLETLCHCYYAPNLALQMSSWVRSWPWMAARLVEGFKNFRALKNASFRFTTFRVTAD